MENGGGLLEELGLGVIKSELDVASFSAITRDYD